MLGAQCYAGGEQAAGAVAQPILFVGAHSEVLQHVSAAREGRSKEEDEDGINTVTDT